MKYEAVIGLEVHAELLTRSKMFCSCPVVDSTQAEPNTTVCPVCAGMPGVLPVVNQQAVELAMRVGLALNCSIAQTSLFARKNYFYPDLPKGYQISQYEYPLATHGYIDVETSQGPRRIRVHRAHLEEDTGKLTHVHNADGSGYSLVDLNRAGVPLLEIVSEPDMHTVEEVRAYATNLRSILRSVGANTGDMEKGVIRFEANVSVRPVGSDELNTRVEIKNLNSFRAMERAILYQVDRQIAIIESGGRVVQETLGWDESRGETYSQRSKEEAHDYRYFPEPDLPPLMVAPEWIERVRASLPELPQAKKQRFAEQYGLNKADAELLVGDLSVTEYFEAALALGEASVTPRSIANWMTGELFGWLNTSGEAIETIKVPPAALVGLIKAVNAGVVNANTGKAVLQEMLKSGASAQAVIEAQGLQQVSDSSLISDMIQAAIAANPVELASYLGGKETVANWFFGQVMKKAGGKANPQVVRAELERQLQALKNQ
ncbi:MAG TPA: Asp-tRNA(Asn)/Glu-tRNA(Gln) amidotransferase subunit GatB [Bellilinea sp.]|jgi:aspartyl-tRNA(Asn)/glutamyl-tRNA(Gln) amidotransferase subunit B|nr:Asp-tRNA(Asn)/Glu-tRNA(Gln) amidotransferase subunit GatB [Bellilinea sp.]